MRTGSWATIDGCTSISVDRSGTRVSGNQLSHRDGPSEINAKCPEQAIDEVRGRK